MVVDFLFFISMFYRFKQGFYSNKTLCLMCNLHANFIIMGTNTGTVKFFNEEKGYGFIKDDNDNVDYFVHANGLVDDINQDDRVSYDLEDGRKGVNAVNVELV